MKQVTLIIALLGAIVLAGCGGNGDTTSQTSFNNGSGNQPFKPISHLSHRSLVTNTFGGALQVMDATQDRLTNFTFTVGGQPTYMQATPDGTLTLVNNSGTNSLSSLNNNLEAVKATVALGGSTESFVSSINNHVGFAAVPNFSNGTFRTPGAIIPFSPTDGSLNTAIPFPNVRHIAMDNGEKHLLAFADADDTAHWVDIKGPVDPVTQVSAFFTLALTNAAGVPVQLSNPVDAFFTADDTKAFILSCGVECTGSANPTVTEIDTTTITVPAPPNNITGTQISAKVINQFQVSGARRGLIDLKANKLYVTGSLSTSAANDCPFTGSAPSCTTGVNVVQDGFFTVIDTAAGTATAPIRIGNGAKRWVRNINGVFWVASLNCGVQSCVSMVNPGTSSASVLSTAKGDATGIALAVNRGEVYTIEGGEFNIYDQKGNPITSEFNTDIKGQASDVLYIN